MKSVYILLALSIFVESCHSVTLNCNDFRSGNYRYLNEGFEHWDITRSDKYQTEYSSRYKVEFKAEIKWESECKYV